MPQIRLSVCVQDLIFLRAAFLCVGGKKMYLALYRKYRPARFEDVAGQTAITETLRRQVAEGKTAHSYLFTGSRGTGKTTCAKILAKAVNCPNAKDGEPCLECDICKGIDNGTLLDVVEMDAASNNGVDQVRLLKEEAVYTPAQSRYRVYIIDEVHMMSVAAFNALLKIMEEPPAHVKFILATTEVHKVPATILSRCQRFDFKRIKPEDIAARLSYIAGQEQAVLEPDAAFLLAKLADGGMRDAVSMLDQCLTVDSHVTTQLVTEITGITGSDYLFSITRQILAGDKGGLLRQVDALYRSSKDLTRFLMELVQHLRSLMLLKADKGCGTLLVCSAQELEQYQAQAEGTSLPFLLRGITVLQQALDSMATSPDKKLWVEMALLKLSDAGLEDSNQALLQRLSALEQQVAELVKNGITLAAAPAAENVQRPAPPVPAEPMNAQQTEEKSAALSVQEIPSEETPVPPEEISPKAEPAKTEHTFPQAPPEYAPPPEPSGEIPPVMEEPVSPKPEPAAAAEPKLLESWGQVLEEISKSNPPLFGVLSGSIAHDIGQGRLVVDSPYEMFSTMIKKENYLSSLQKALAEVTGHHYRILAKKKKKAAVQENRLEQLEQRAKQLQIPIVHPDDPSEQ